MKRYLKLIVLSIFLVVFVIIGFFLNNYLGKVATFEPVSIKISGVESKYLNKIVVSGITPRGRTLPLSFNKTTGTYNAPYGFFKGISIGANDSIIDAITAVQITTGKEVFDFINISLDKHWQRKFDLNGQTVLITPPSFKTKASKLSMLASIRKWDQIKKLLLINLAGIIILFSIIFYKKLNSLVLKISLTVEKKVSFYSIMLIVSLLAVIPFVFLSFFAYPSPEDYYIIANMRQDMFNNPFASYLNKDGRYFANIIYLINPLAFKSLLGNKLFILSIIISFWGVCCLFLRNLLGSEYKISKILTVGSLITAIFFNLMPSVSTGLYWFCAVIVYIIPLMLLMLLISLLINGFRKGFTVARSTFIFLSIFMLNGLHEMYIPISIAILFFSCCFAFYKCFSCKKILLLFLFFSVVTASIVVFAPGNMNRISVSHENSNDVSSLLGFNNLFKAIMFSINSMFISIKKFLIINPGLIALSLLFIPAASEVSGKNNHFKGNLIMHPFTTIVLFFLFMILPVLPYYLVGENGNLYMDRLFNPICFFFITLWFLNIQAYVSFFKRKAILKEFRMLPLIKVLLIILFISSFAFPSSNVRQAYTDIFNGDIFAYKKEMDHRIQKLTRTYNNVCCGKKIVVLEKIQHQPQTVLYQDFEKNMNLGTFHFRQGMAAFFGLGEVRYVKDNSPFKNTCHCDPIKQTEKPVIYNQNSETLSFYKIAGEKTNDIESFKKYYFCYNMYDSTFIVAFPLSINKLEDSSKIKINITFNNSKDNSFIGTKNLQFDSNIFKDLFVIVVYSNKINPENKENNDLLNAIYDDRLILRFN
ncbi:MAG: hypothetical protein M0R16_05035 [Bacteroidales bacterium]|jgi:hypothetical protein|nr:hypothetical protein [Bacteroidales bacterium]